MTWLIPTYESIFAHASGVGGLCVVSYHLESCDVPAHSDILLCSLFLSDVTCILYRDYSYLNYRHSVFSQVFDLHLESSNNDEISSMVNIWAPTERTTIWNSTDGHGYADLLLRWYATFTKYRAMLYSSFQRCTRPRHVAEFFIPAHWPRRMA